MKNTENKHIFDYSHKDEWENVFVYCPVCLFQYKIDGIKKHIIRMSQSGEPKHAKWLQDNPCKKGQKAAIKY